VEETVLFHTSNFPGVNVISCIIAASLYFYICSSPKKEHTLIDINDISMHQVCKENVGMELNEQSQDKKRGFVIESRRESVWDMR
jgi:hypothetical protein